MGFLDSRPLVSTIMKMVISSEEKSFVGIRSWLYIDTAIVVYDAENLRSLSWCLALCRLGN